MTDLELQLKVWKDLAISKQVLMRAATDALKLEPNCTHSELQAALEATIKRSIEADSEVSKAREEAKTAIAAMQSKLADTEKALQVAEASRVGLLASQQQLQEQAVAERARTAEEMAKLKQRLADRERELKAINTALADTPDNVLKKLKSLRKEKKDEADARKQAETATTTLRKEKAKLEQELKAAQDLQESAGQLATQYRELHTLCGTLHEQLQSLVEDAQTLPAMPVLESALLEKIDSASAAEEKKPGGKGKR